MRQQDPNASSDRPGDSVAPRSAGAAGTRLRQVAITALDNPYSVARQMGLAWVRGRFGIADLVRGAAEGLGLDSIRLDLAGRSSPLSAQVLRSAQWSLRSVYRTSAGDGRVAAR